MMLVRPPFRAAITPPYFANSVHFLAPDRAKLTADWVGNADSPVGIISFWFNMKGGNENDQSLQDAQGVATTTKRLCSNKWQQKGLNSSGTVILKIKTVKLYTTTVNSGWNHALFTWDLNAAAADRVALFVNGVSDINVITANAGSLGWTKSPRQFGESSSGEDRMNMEIADFYLNNEASLTRTGLGTSIDAADLAKFRNPVTDKPVFLGSNGEIPTGASPRVFFTGDTATWHQNVGTGGTYILTGTLTTGTTSPSD